ncbi:MAG: Uma2 family endonuclease [Deltaproteobacteria bacterium]|nr:Uma2 family endonuclease [Deltaproteobacteria bacterium]
MAETAFQSDESFAQREFWEWVNERPRSDLNHYELINGRIVMTPPAGWPHGGIGSNLNVLLGTHVRGGKLGRVFDASTGFELPSGDTVEPDVSFISGERIAVGPAPERRKFLRMVPNLVVEILSDPTARRDRTEKKQIYETNGVDEYWLVDPDRREVTVFHLVGEHYGPGEIFRRGLISSQVLPALAFTVDDVFEL